MMKGEARRRILIYRLGSLGDTVVALPSLRLIERVFPEAERFMLTNFSINSREARMAQVLDGTSLVHGYFEYPVGVRDLRALLRLRNTIQQFRPDMLVYLAEPRGRLKALRDATFFHACGIHHLIGEPFSESCQHPLYFENGYYEYEGSRLLRCLRSLGEMDLNDPSAFDLHLNNRERKGALKALEPLTERRLLIAVSAGAKVDVKDWGERNWSKLLDRLGRSFPSSGLILLGAEAERNRSEALLKHWGGAGLNLCGRMTVRESAAILDHTDLFIGHDSGPMHLAAAMGKPCVAIFSSRNLPGEWFPYGKNHKVLYKPMACQGCKLSVCEARQKACILSITVDQVEAEIHNVLPS